jgi:hypothetical protein
MKKSQDKEIHNFLNEIKLADSEKYKSLIEIREYVFQAYPETKEKLMYGGIVFFLNNEMFSGIFVNKNGCSSHITQLICYNIFRRVHSKNLPICLILPLPSG